MGMLDELFARGMDQLPTGADAAEYARKYLERPGALAHPLTALPAFGGMLSSYLSRPGPAPGRPGIGSDVVAAPPVEAHPAAPAPADPSAYNPLLDPSLRNPQPGGPAAKFGMLNDPATGIVPQALTPPTPQPMDISPSAVNAQPDPAALPENSTLTADLPKNADVPETSLLGRLGGLFGRVQTGIRENPQMLMALGAGLAGAPTLGVGMSRGLALAGPASQLDTKQTQQNQTIEALVKKGVPRDVAISAATNPAIMSQILPNIFGAKQKKFTQIGEDFMGNKKFGFVDEVSGKTYDLMGKEMSPANAGATNIPTGPDGSPLQGAELMTHLEKNDPVTAAAVKSMIEGKMNPGSRNLQKLAPMAALIDPSFEGSDYKTRAQNRINYTSGKQFQELQAINTVAGHLDNLRKSADALDNTSFPILNQVKNIWNTNTGDPRVDKFNTVKQAVTNELSKAYRGGHVTEGDVKEWQSNIGAAKSPEQLRSVIGEMNDLLMSKRQALEDGYRSGMGRAPLPAEFSAVSDKARETFDRVAEWAHGAKPATAAPTGAPATPAAPAAPAPPKVGEVKAGFRFRGGDPANPASWEHV